MRRSFDLLADRRVHLPRQEALAELRTDIVRAAYVEGDFMLTGGLRRSYYFDKYLFETQPALLRRLSRFLADLVPRGRPKPRRMRSTVFFLTARGWQERRIRARIFEANHARKPDKKFTMGLLRSR